MTRRKDQIMRDWYERYSHSNLCTLDDVYIEPSYRKVKGYYNCLNLMCKLNGKHGRIVTFNSQMFTFGFIAELNGIVCYIHITPNKIYYMEV